MAEPVSITEPIRTEPNPTHYEWAGASLQRLFASPTPIAETWAFFSGPSRAARVASPVSARGMSLDRLLADQPALLGPSGADPECQGQKYFFVKFLDPSDFPAFAYAGFAPEPADAVRRALEHARGRAFADEAEWLAAFRAHVAGLMWEDRQAVEAFAALVRGRVTSPDAFARLKTAYKAWAIAQAAADWAAPAAMALEDLVDPAQRPAAAHALARQQSVRRALSSLLHRIDFEDDQAILIETPTLHAIAGLSLQIHPKAPGNFFPKDELWIYKRLDTGAGAGADWVLVEPQRTFDKTEAGADFFTPFAWQDRGGLGFRKPISEAYVRTFVELMDARAFPRGHFVRRATPGAPAGWTVSGQAQWMRVVDEPAWPYFVVRELRFAGPGEAAAPLSASCYTELHVTQGRVEIRLSAPGGASYAMHVSPAEPALLPATLPYSSITYRASGPASVHLFTRA